VCVNKSAKFLVVFLLYYRVNFVSLAYTLFDSSILNSLIDLCLKLVSLVGT
jgi:hypothetical protein